MFARVFKALGANFLGQVLNLVQRVLLVPMFLSAWGTNGYADWLLLTSIAAYFALLDLGGQIYVINRMTQCHSTGDTKGFREYLHTGLAGFLAVPLLVLLVFCVVFAFVPIGRVLSLAATSEGTATLVVMLAALQFAVTLPVGVLLGIYRATGRLPLSFMLGNAIVLLQIAFTAGALLMDRGLIVVAAVQIVPYLLVAIGAVAHVGVTRPDLGLLLLRDANLSTARSLLKPSLHFFGLSMAQSLQIQGTLVLAGTLLGPAALVLFSTQRTLAGLVRQALGMIFNSVWPEITRLDAQGRRETLAAVFGAVMRTTFAACAVCVVVLHFLGAWIFERWVGDHVVYDQRAMDLMLLYIAQFVFWTLCSNLLMAINRHHALSWVVLAASAAGLAGAWIGGQYGGLHGFVAGMILAEVLLPVWIVPYLLHRYDRAFSWRFFARTVLPPVGLGVLAVTSAPLAPVAGVVLIVWWGFDLNRTRRLLARPTNPAS